ncbi:hypothetical protein [Shimia sp. MMG029]|uniref:hypothetical protein n=1 Tax=Shimia sp. MMG029 TaxID=3021978 RepID=UPI0022FE9C9C|nr:hypothetical protein [Shimia sp. MMG029]MDA5556135.1 hypothetical protein [Shimia sp. MMG029]
MFEHLKNQIEHSLGLHANSYVTFPANMLYDQGALETYKDDLDRCHIYLVGWCEPVNVKSLRKVGKKVVIVADIGAEERIAELDTFTDARLDQPSDNDFCTAEGASVFFRGIHPSALHELGGQPFEVVYVGQAFGKNGERKAIDRLLEHKKLQEISLKGDAKGRQLTLLLLEVSTQKLFTVITPKIQDDEISDVQIQNGIDKLHGTSEAERISLYEAALIRYFYPSFNKIFKDSFPSTNLSVLSDCYKKDIGGVVAELCFDNFPFLLQSARAKAEFYHIAKFNLHNENDRNIFFYGE